MQASRDLMEHVLTNWVRFLMFLAYVPLLLPIGLCICHSDEHHGTRTKQAGTESVSDLSPTHANEPSCRHLHAHLGSNGADRSSDQATHSAPEPKDGHHDPVCPAMFADFDWSHWSEPAPTIVDLSPLGFVAIDLPLLRPMSQSSIVSTSQMRPPTLPLYVAHCSLVV